MSTRRDKLNDFIGVVMGWGTLVGLIYIAQIPAPMNEYLIIAATIFFALAFTWVYLDQRIGDPSKVPATMRGVRFLRMILLVTACINEGFSLYILFQTSYLWGEFDALASLARPYGIAMPTESLPILYRGVASSVVGVALSTFTIAFAVYSRGVLQGRKSSPSKPSLPLVA